MGEGRYMLASGLLQSRRDVAEVNRLSCQPTEAHEIQAGDRVPFDDLEREERDHAGEPRHPEEGPTAVDRDDQPRSRAEKEEGAGHDEAVIEHGDAPDGFSKSGQL